MPPDLARSEASLIVLGLKVGSLVSSTGVIGESDPLSALEDEVLGVDGEETGWERTTGKQVLASQYFTLQSCEA
jgi:hypothetical protein